MSNLRYQLGQVMTFVITLLVLTACSSKKENGVDVKLAAVASDESALVMVGNVKKLFEQLDVEVTDNKIKLPEYLQSAINSMLDSEERSVVNNFVDEIEGLDYDDVVLAVNMNGKNAEAVLVFGVDDETDFEKSVMSSDKEVKKENIEDFVVLECEGLPILLKDNLAYVVFNDKNVDSKEAADILKERKGAAEATPLNDWKKAYLVRDEVCNVLLDMETMSDICKDIVNQDLMEKFRAGAMGKGMEGYLGVALNLNGPTLRISSCNFDKEGKEIKNPYVGKFNTEMMDYAYATDFVAIGVSANQEGYELLGESIRAQFATLMEDSFYKYYFNIGQYERIVNTVSALPAEYVSDGGVFVSGGFAEGIKLSNLEYDSPLSYHLVAVVDLQPEKARNAYEAVCKEFEAISGSKGKTERENGVEIYSIKLKYAEDYDMYEDAWRTSSLDVYIALDGTKLIVTNAPVRRSNQINFNKEIFDGCCAAMQTVINDKTPVISEFGFKEGLNAYVVSKATENVFEATLTETDNKFVPAVFGLIGI